jgi:hypothetical protein
MKDILFHENSYYSKSQKPLPSWTPAQKQAWTAGYQFGLRGDKLPFDPKAIKYWNYGFELAMQERRRQEEILCM